MILKLRTADFSANNIGKVQVTALLDDYTKAAIIASGNKEMTLVQKSALNDFFVYLKDNSLLSKMRKIYLPIIASDVSNAMINYATNDFTKDATPNSSIWSLRNHGLVASSTPTGNFTFEINNPIVANNFSVFWLRTELFVPGVLTEQKIITLRGKTDTTLFLGPLENSVSSNTTISWGSYGAIPSWGTIGKTIASITEVKSAALICRGASDIDKNNYGTWKTLTVTSLSDFSGETAETVYVLGVANNNTLKPYGVVMLGEAVTTAQGKEISANIDALWEAFNV